jgi:hypothetical protein
MRAAGLALALAPPQVRTTHDEPSIAFDSGMKRALGTVRRAKPDNDRERARVVTLHARRRARCDEVAWVICELHCKTILEET